MRILKTYVSKRARLVLGSCLMLFTLCAQVQSETQRYETRIGELEFRNGFEQGYPTDETVARLFDAYDFNSAVTAYNWAIPLIGFWGSVPGDGGCHA